METRPQGLFASSTHTSDEAFRCEKVKKRCESDSFALITSCELKGWNYSEWPPSMGRSR